MSNDSTGANTPELHVERVPYTDTARWISYLKELNVKAITQYHLPIVATDLRISLQSLESPENIEAWRNTMKTAYDLLEFALEEQNLLIVGQILRSIAKADAVPVPRYAYMNFSFYSSLLFHIYRLFIKHRVGPRSDYNISRAFIHITLLHILPLLASPLGTETTPSLSPQSFDFAPHACSNSACRDCIEISFYFLTDERSRRWSLTAGLARRMHVLAQFQNHVVHRNYVKIDVIKNERAITKLRFRKVLPLLVHGGRPSVQNWPQRRHLAEGMMLSVINGVLGPSRWGVFLKAIILAKEGISPKELENINKYLGKWWNPVLFPMVPSWSMHEIQVMVSSRRTESTNNLKAQRGESDTEASREVKTSGEHHVHLANDVHTTDPVREFSGLGGACKSFLDYEAANSFWGGNQQNGESNHIHRESASGKEKAHIFKGSAEDKIICRAFVEHITNNTT